jgi:RNA recognition motif-containing protein
LSYRLELTRWFPLQKKPKKAADGTTPAVDGEAAPAADGTAAPADGEKKPKTRKPKAAKPRRPAGEDPVGEPSKTMLFVANLGFALEDPGLEALFKDAGIDVKTAHVVRRRWGNPRRSKGYGFVEVADEEQQKKALEALNGKEVGGRPIAVKVAIDAKEAMEAIAEGNAAAAADAAAAPEVTVVAS